LLELSDGLRGLFTPADQGYRRNAFVVDQKNKQLSRLPEDNIMWRSLFLAIGVILVLVGVQCLGVAQFTLKIREEAPASTFLDGGVKLGAQRVITPPPWAPWSLMSTGIVVCLYSFTLPKRVAGN
jgi:hypothetical protein